MEILILADLEGITGIYDMEDKNYCRYLFTKEICVIVDVLHGMGIYGITVCDVHNKGDTLDTTLMQKKKVIVISQIWNIDYEKQYDAAILTGFHGMKGAGGIWSHTFRDDINKIIIGNNEKVIGEVGFFIIWLAGHGIPVLNVMGDSMACTEAKEIDSSIIVCETKRLGVRMERMEIYTRIQKRIEMAFVETLKKRHTLNVMCEQINIELENKEIFSMLDDKWKKDNGMLVFDKCDDFVCRLEMFCNDLNLAIRQSIEQSMLFVNEVYPYLSQMEVEDVRKSQIGFIFEKTPYSITKEEKNLVMKYINSMRECNGDN